MTAPKEQVLYLFSSNIRRLYEQDILDVIAEPPGIIHRFRFKPHYVAPEAQGGWHQLAAMNTPVLLNFSLQHPAAYHEAAFVPVRRGTVTKAYEDAGIHIVEFEVGDYVALAPPQIGKDGVKLLGDEVKRYAAYLDRAGVPHPYTAWASLGPDATADPNSGVDASATQDALFERTVTYLQRTSSFERARFYRVLGVVDARGGKVGFHSGELPIVAGHGYQVRLAHIQPQEVDDRSSFKVVVDTDIIELLRLDTFEISSRYDTIEVPFVSKVASAIRGRLTHIGFKPESRTQAAHLSIPIRVSPNTKQVATAVGGGAVVVVAVALPTIFASWSWIGKVAAIGIGGVITGVLALYGLKR
jgi:hypothetical protein